MPKILIVEDEGLVSADIEFCLQGIGYSTVAATSGELALEVAARMRLDLALLDIRLSGALDGVEAALLLRDRFQLGSVFLTAHADEATLARAREADPLGYLLKPFRDEDLRATVASAIGRSRPDSNRPEPREARKFEFLGPLTDGSAPRG